MKKLGMKKLGLIIIACVFVLSMTAFAACSKTQLSAPLSPTLNRDVKTISWRSVENATGYVVNVNGQQYPVEDNSYDYSQLTPDNYTFKIKATGGKGFSDSPYSEEIVEILDLEPGLKYRAINGETEYEITGIVDAAGDIVIGATYAGKPITTIAKSAFATTNKELITSVTLGKNIKKIAEYAFQSCTNLTSFSFGEAQVTTIGNHAFSYNRNLTSIDIPDSVTSMGSSAFMECTLLKDVTIGTGLTTIASSAFYATGFTSLEFGTETFGKNVKTINASAFAKCPDLVSVSLGDNMQGIGEKSFAECLKLSTVDLGNSVDYIGISAFADDIALVDIDIPANVKTIDNYAFRKSGIWEKFDGGLVIADKWIVGYRSTSTAPLVIPDKIESISNAAFAIEVTTTNASTGEITTSIEGAAFTAVQFGTGIKNIGANAFYHCFGLTSVTLPNTIKEIRPYTFNNCKNLKSVVIPEGIEKIGLYAFYSCKLLNNVKIPDTVTEIDDYAFIACSALDKITIGEGVRRIGNWAFYNTALWKSATSLVYADNWIVGCVDPAIDNSRLTFKAGLRGLSSLAFSECLFLTEIILPTGVVSIGDWAFYSCENIKKVFIPDTVEVIGDFAFYKCTSLSNLTIGKNVEKIGESAFRNCSSLFEVKIPDSVVEIGMAAFRNCVILAEVTLGNGLAEVSPYMFYGCSFLNTVKFGTGIKSIGEYAFYRCNSLKAAVLPQGVLSIGRSAFYACANLVTVVLPDSIEYIDDYVFYECKSIKSIVLPAIDKIGTYSFYGCEKLSEVVIPSGVTEIGSFAFFGTAITSIVIPKTVTIINMYAFRNCTQLTSVVLHDGIETIGSHVFYGARNLTIYAEASAAKATWARTYNSSNRPIIWGCTLSANKDYVVSWTKQTIPNVNARNGINAPYREGYTFDGWSKQSGGTTIDFTAQLVKNSANGTNLYAIYTPNTGA